MASHSKVESGTVRVKNSYSWQLYKAEIAIGFKLESSSAWIWVDYQGVILATISTTSPRCRDTKQCADGETWWW